MSPFRPELRDGSSWRRVLRFGSCDGGLPSRSKSSSSIHRICASASCHAESDGGVRRQVSEQSPCHSCDPDHSIQSGRDRVLSPTEYPMARGAVSGLSKLQRKRSRFASNLGLHGCSLASPGLWRPKYFIDPPRLEAKFRISRFAPKVQEARCGC